MFLVRVLYYIHWRWIDPSLFLAAYILKYQTIPLLIQNVYGVRVAEKSVLYTPSPYTVSGWPSLRFCDFTLKTSLLLSTRGKAGVLLFSSSPLKPSFRLLSLISCLIVHDRHDKRLCFFYIFYQQSLAILAVILFFCFSAQNGRFSISQKCDVTIRIFEHLKSQNILTLLFTNK